MRFRKDGDLLFQLDKILNKGVGLSDNISGGLVTFTTTGDVQEISHSLGYRPIGFLVLLVDDPSNGAGPYSVWSVRNSEWTSEKLYCKSNAANLKVRLFVL